MQICFYIQDIFLLGRRGNLVRKERKGTKENQEKRYMKETV